MAKNKDNKSMSLRAIFLVAIALSVIVIILIMLLTGNAIWALIAGLILFILVTVGKIIILDLIIRKK